MTEGANGRPRKPDHLLNYEDVHYRLWVDRGRASQFSCHCGEQAEQWAYQHAGKTRYDERGRAYSTDLNDYLAMCRSCHNKLDHDHGRRERQLERAREGMRTPEAREKLRTANLGRVKTLEQRESNRQGALKMWERRRASN